MHPNEVTHAHGSRIKEATEEAIAFIETVKEKVDVSLQEICFLELAEPTIHQGMHKLIDLLIGCSAMN